MEGAAMLWLLRFPRRTQAQPSAKQESYPCGLRCGAGARQGGRAWSRGNLAPNPPTWAAAAAGGTPLTRVKFYLPPRLSYMCLSFGYCDLLHAALGPPLAR